MRSIKLFLSGLGLMIGTIAFGQFSNSVSAAQPELQSNKQGPKGKKKCWSKTQMNIGLGIANYYGDLTENFHLFNQSSFSLGAGLSYRIIPHLSARADIAVNKIQASDSRNNRVDLQNRNLSFKSFVWDLNLAVQYEVLNLDKYKVTPYVFVGFGVFYFNPYTKDANGYKQFLQYLGTEGQGLTGYPDRKKYKRTQFEIPFGGGLKWAVNKKINLGLEYKFRKTNTDYLDDVSRLGYPNKALLDAKNPRTATLTWRGGEVGAGGYPTNPNLNRGNPNKNDVFYTMQFKVGIQL